MRFSSGKRLLTWLFSCVSTGYRFILSRLQRINLKKPTFLCSLCFNCFCLGTGQDKRVLNSLSRTGFLAVRRMISVPPLPSANCLSFSNHIAVGVAPATLQSLSSPQEDGEKAWSSTNHSILRILYFPRRKK
jgi:hypothetical protein